MLSWSSPRLMLCSYASLRKESDVLSSLQSGSHSASTGVGDGLSADAVSVDVLLQLLLGYPLAYFLSFYAGKQKDLLYQLVIIPLWVSYLVRAYAWKTILGSDGVLNTLLQYVHLTKHPLEFLLYSPFAVVLTLTHIYTPFTFLPIYAALEHIPRNLVEASHDLGATPAQTFWKVIFP